MVAAECALFFSLGLICATLPTGGARLARIVGGFEAQDGGYPYQASLRIFGSHKCGGSVINQRWILTAGHCLANYDVRTLTVVVGSNNLAFDGIAYRAVLAHVHPEYNKTRRTGDIGLLMIDGLIHFSNDVQPIFLPNSDVDDRHADCFVVGLLAGWGNTYRNGATNNELQVIVLNVIQLTTCQETFPEVGAEHLCTLNKAGEGVCYGDSGSALVSNGTVIGVASWGTPCARGYPDVYTRVYHYLAWITAIIGIK